MIAKAAPSVCLFLLLGIGMLEAEEKTSLEEIRAGAARGEAVAMRRLGHAFQRGNYGLGPNMMKAVELYLKAAEKGDSWAINNLGHIYFEEGEESQTVSSNFSKGLEYLNRAAELGVPNAHALLASTYCWGKSDYCKFHVRVDHDKALQHAGEADRLCDIEKHGTYPKAMGNLVIGEVKLKIGDDKGAFEALTESVRHSDYTAAHYHLAKLYFEGRGTERDFQKAAQHAEQVIDINPDFKETRELLEEILSAIQTGKK